MTKKSWDEQRRDEIAQNIRRLQDEIAELACKAGRDPAEIRLMAVSKTVEAQWVNQAIACGVTLLGENRVQELVAKREQLAPHEMHLIGHLQTNKVRDVVGKVDLIQSVDSVRLARLIGKEAVKKDTACGILLEVNIGAEESKFGFSPQEIAEATQEISELEGVFIRGLMCVAPICEKKQEIHAFFSNMHRLFLDIRAQKIDNVSMDILSMGMSADYPQAIAEGATLIRLGSAIFGHRNYEK